MGELLRFVLPIPTGATRYQSSYGTWPDLGSEVEVPEDEAHRMLRDFEHSFQVISQARRDEITGETDRMVRLTGVSADTVLAGENEEVCRRVLSGELDSALQDLLIRERRSRRGLRRPDVVAAIQQRIDALEASK